MLCISPRRQQLWREPCERADDAVAAAAAAKGNTEGGLGRRTALGGPASSPGAVQGDVSSEQREGGQDHQDASRFHSYNYKRK